LISAGVTIQFSFPAMSERVQREGWKGGRREREGRRRRKEGRERELGTGRERRRRRGGEEDDTST
jgi:hypothetical protein